jgi:hypothetical protein
MKNGLEIDKDGSKRYYLNDQLHREDGPAIERVDGTKAWYQNGVLHRLDGPAYEGRVLGTRSWYQYGQRHRLDGPAIEWSDGRKFWYFHDEEIDCKSQEEFEEYLKLIPFS